ncbi:hypothetical protein GJ699_02345 [Duganella sp. FT80W]|uniref:Uncharacterized protein n=1 Tax=Duganella guangzhouensis TaxID=2666084 RepID=A0A6I2KTZ6_9BURK|nr:hypothetical protein [Duganella guangzhouensis]MRW88820.1 hypothetical protein [Duganella guangzhouensis]
MSDHRDALADIMRLCATSRTYTRRVQNINEVAMVALGMTANQRHAQHLEILDRIGDQPFKDAYMKRKARREEKFSTLLEAAQHEDAFGAYHLDGAQ